MTARPRRRFKVVAGLRLAVVLALSGLTLLRAEAEASETRMGTISFPNSGKAEAQEPFIRGVLALHNFWFPEAEEAFKKAQEIDPGFALAYWGEAMSHNHPLWAEQDMPAARAALQKLGATRAERSAKAPDRAREGLSGGRRGALRRRRQARARSRLLEAHGTHGRALPRRRRGEGALCPVPARHGSAGRQGFRPPDEVGGHPRRRPAAQPAAPRRCPLHHPLLRRPRACSPRLEGGRPLRADRARGAARPPHADPHLRPARNVGPRAGLERGGLGRLREMAGEEGPLAHETGLPHPRVASVRRAPARPVRQGP